MKFRNLKASEIEIRAQRVTEKGAVMLLYKDARCDMNILDDEIGAMNWQRHHSRDNANCIISIWDEEKKQWIEKEDTGTESNTEKEKGLASDSFKRAGTNWGIGRELYTAPFIYLYSNSIKIDKSPKGKLEVKDDLCVSAIDTTEDKKIVGLEITNESSGKVVFSFGTCKNGKKYVHQPEEKPEQPKKNANEEERIADIETVLSGIVEVARASKHDTGEVKATLIKALGASCEEVEEFNKAQLKAAIKQLAIWQNNYKKLDKGE